MSQPSAPFSPSPWQSQPNGQTPSGQPNGKRPTDGAGDLPVKKPRISPPPGQSASPGPYHTSPSTPSPMQQSPYATQASFKYPTLPPNAYSSRLQNNPHPPLQQGEPMPSPALSQASPMGPPQRPADRATPGAPVQAQATSADPEKKEKETNNFDALNDVALSAGIDLTREDEYLRERRVQPASFDATQSSGAFADRGSLSQATEDSIQDDLFKKHKAAARAMNERTQQHMENPFLQGHSLRKRLERASTSKEFSADPRASIKLPMEGLFDLQKSPDEREVSVTKMTHATDGSALVSAVLKAPSKVTKDAPIAAMLSLLSLGCEEYVRSLVEESFGEARNRRYNSDGVVAPEWADLATNPDIPAELAKAQPETTTQTSLEQPQGDSPVETKMFPRAKDPTMTSLLKVARQDRKAEEARAKRKAERKSRRAQAKVAAASGDADSVSVSGAELPKPMSKKELQKQQKADYSEEAATRSANQTAAMQLGGKSYSWMTGKGKGGLGGRKQLQAAGLGGGGSGPSTSSASKSGQPAHSAKDTKFGVWREDGVGGQGVQMRDWVLVLERDLHCRRTLETARSQLGRERTGDSKTEQPPPPPVAAPAPAPAAATTADKAPTPSPATPTTPAQPVATAPPPPTGSSVATPAATTPAANPTTAAP